MGRDFLFPKNSWMTGTILLVVMSCVAFFPCFQNLYVWDDGINLTENPYLNDFSGLKRIWFDLQARAQYYPLVDTSYWIEHKIWGFDPLGYHVNNVIIHCFNALLLWRILSFLEVKGSWLAAAIFAIHPIQVESVAWITERKNLLSGFFYFLSLYSFLHFYNPDKAFSFNEEQNKKRSWLIYGVSLLLYMFALLSKTAVCTLPAVILLIHWWKQNCISKKISLMMLPFFALSAGFALITIELEISNVGTIGPEWDFSFWDRFLIAGRVLWFYIGKLFWPDPIIFIYPRWNIDDSIWWQYLYPIAFLSLIFILWNFRKHIGRGPLVAILFFAGSLFPILGFFDLYFMKFSFVADHFQYLACIGIIVLFTSGAEKLMGEKRPWTTLMPLAIILIVLGNITWNLGPVYKDAMTLWRDTIRKNPDAWLAHDSLGVLLFDKQKYQEAIPYFKTTIKLKPDFADAHYGLGKALFAKRKAEEAITHFETAIELKPTHSMAHNDLGNVFLSQGKTEEAISHFKTALRFNPGISLIHNNLGNALLAIQKTEEAISEYETALKLTPGFLEAHNNLGNAFMSMRKTEEAIFHYESAIKLKPDFTEAHYNLGSAFLSIQKINEAVSHFKEAIKLSPGYALAHNNLGNALLSMRKNEEAIFHYKTVLKLKPDLALTHVNLGMALFAERKDEEAISYFKKAIELKPDFPEAHYHLGNTLSKLKRYDQAVEYFETAIRLKADYANAYLNLANALVHKGEVKESIAYYKEAIRLNENYADAHYSLGVIYGQSGNFGEAAAHFERVVSINPNYANARKNLELARSMANK